MYALDAENINIKIIFHIPRVFWKFWDEFTVMSYILLQICVWAPNEFFC